MKLLHISDIHFDTPSGGDRALLQEALFDKAMTLNFDLVAFSGDVANKGIKEHYAPATDFLTRLTTKGAPVLIVPGNHDVDRSKINGNELFNAFPSEKHFQKNRSDVLRPGRFDNFQVFSAPYAFKWQQQQMTVARTTLYQFDFLGLNTALLSHTDSDSGQLAVDADDLQDTLGQLDAHAFVIAIGHHPLNELVPWNRTIVSQCLKRTKRGAHLYLCGHLHDVTGESHYSIEGSGLVTFQAGAAYQAAQWDKTFSLITIDQEQQHLGIEVFRFNPDSGGFELDSHNSHDLPILWPTATATQSAPQATNTQPTLRPASPLPLTPRSPEDLIKKLERIFGLVWEAERADPCIRRIFWPVRLRRPTLIHAAQAPIAAAFQNCGVSVSLCLDDFGNSNSEDLFLDRMRKHFAYVGADWGKVEVLKASEVVNADRLRRTWELLATWLTGAADLQGVLTICKLLVREARNAEYLGKVLTKKPRKLMTPAVVWTCFDYVLTRTSSDAAGSVATLGGYDERGFWQAWQAAFGPRHKVGHLYGPALSRISDATNVDQSEDPLAMAEYDSDAALDWRSLNDIRDTLRQDTGPVNDDHRILGWLISQCLILPMSLANQTLTLCGEPLYQPSDLTSLVNLPREALIQDVAARANELLLG